MYLLGYVIRVKVLAGSSIALWLGEFVRVYLNNNLPGQENENGITEVVIIKAQDSNKYMFQIYIW